MTKTIAARIHQRTDAIFRSVISTTPAAVLVRDGHKQISTQAGSYAAPEGHVVLLPDRTALEICNKPGSEGHYSAAIITVPRSLIAFTEPDSYASATDDSRVVGAFERALIASCDPLVPESIRAHYVQEILLWLNEVGICFPPTRNLNVADRVRDLVCKSLDNHWKADEVASQLGMSEASLRRHLANLGTNFSSLLVDARMTQALALLQSTDLSINRIALEVGYASPSQFAARFRDRFDVPPSAIRGGILIGSGQ